MLLILPAMATAFPASSAFARAGYEDHWRRLAVIIFGLTFPAWIMGLHTLTYFALAAAGLRAWRINGADLTAQSHLALTALAAGVVSAAAMGVLGRSWFLLGMGLFTGTTLGLLTWLGEPATLAGIVFWLIATWATLRAWGEQRRRALGGDGPGPQAALPYTEHAEP